MNNTTSTPRILVLPSGHEIRADLLEKVRSRIPELDPNQVYSLEEICGKDFWQTLPKTHRILGGITIAHLVKMQQLALEFTTCPHAVPKKYRRK